ncbi:hypothetical protein Tcan_01163, partial [Toxocara canis]
FSSKLRFLSKKKTQSIGHSVNYPLSALFRNTGCFSVCAGCKACLYVFDDAVIMHALFIADERISAGVVELFPKCICGRSQKGWEGGEGWLDRRLASTTTSDNAEMNFY